MKPIRLCDLGSPLTWGLCLAVLGCLVVAWTGAAAEAASGEPLEVSGYLEESFAGQGTAAQTVYYLLSHLRLRVSFPGQDGVSARGEFDLYGLGAKPFSLDEETSVPATAAAAAIDRLYLRLVSGETQATLGRQRISWGNGSAFAPADFFNPPNPLDPRGARRGADGLLVRRSLGQLGYAAAAAAYVDPTASPLAGLTAELPSSGEGAGSGVSGGLSGSLKAGTHVGRTDLDLGWGYDAVNRRHLAFVEARGDLGVGWHASLARLYHDDGAEEWAGAAGVDYSFAGKLLTTVEYAAGPAPGDVGFDGLPRTRPRWAVGATYLPSEVTSFGTHVVVDTAPGAPSAAVFTLSQNLTSALDLSARLAWPFGEAAGPAAAWRGAGELRLRYSF